MTISRRPVSDIPAAFAPLSPVVCRAWSPCWESCCWDGKVHECYITNPPLSEETPSMTVFLAQRSLYPCLPTLKGIITLINIFNPFETDSHLRLTVNVPLKCGLYSEITQGCRAVSATSDAFEEAHCGSRGVVLCHSLPQPLQAVPFTSKDAPPALSSSLATMFFS